MKNSVELGNSGKYLAREIKLAPAHMLPREFTQNGIDNAARGVKSLITWSSTEIKGTTKLMVYDNGTGMTPEEFKVFTETMGVSLGDKDDSGNHGVGARMVGLHSNPSGLVYYTKSKKRAEIYKAVLGLNAAGEPVCLMPPTPVKSAPVDLGKHGTCVVFMGVKDTHNTVKEPWAGSPKTISALPSQLAKRYWTYPKGTEIRFEKETSWDPRNRGPKGYGYCSIKSISDYLKVEKQDVVKLDGLTITYSLLKKERQRLGAIMDIEGMGLVTLNGEVYSIVDKNRGGWAAEAEYFGLESIADRVVITIDVAGLPGLSPNTQRESLIWEAANNRPGYWQQRRYAVPRNFTPEVVGNMPAWLSEEAEKNKRKMEQDEVEEIYKAQRAMFKELMAFTPKLVADPNGNEIGDTNIQPVTPIGEHVSDVPSPNPNPTPTPVLTVVPGGADKAKIKNTYPPNCDVKFEAMDEPFRLTPPVVSVSGTTDPAKITVNSEDILVKKLKQEVEGILEQDVEKFWLTVPMRYGGTTLGKYWISIAMMKARKPEEDDNVFFAQPVTCAIFGHWLEFKAAVLKGAREEKKLRNSRELSAA